MVRQDPKEPASVEKGICKVHKDYKNSLQKYYLQAVLLSEKIFLKNIIPTLTIGNVGAIMWMKGRVKDN